MKILLCVVLLMAICVPHSQTQQPSGKPTKSKATSSGKSQPQPSGGSTKSTATSSGKSTKSEPQPSGGSKKSQAQPSGSSGNNTVSKTPAGKASNGNGTRGLAERPRNRFHFHDYYYDHYANLACHCSRVPCHRQSDFRGRCRHVWYPRRLGYRCCYFGFGWPFPFGDFDFDMFD